MTNRRFFNFVREDVLRGPAPSDSQLKQLSDIGVRTILNLHTFDQNAELWGCYRHGMNLVNLDLPGFLIPDEGDLQIADALVDDKSLRPIYIHCRHGRERTGLVVARFRIRSGWNTLQAQTEMIQMGCRFPWHFAYYSRLMNHPRGER